MTKIFAALLVFTAIAFPAIAQKKPQAKPKGNILMVVTSHGRLGDQDKPTGFWLSEVSHAWAPFVDDGYAVTFASPRGGAAPVEPRSIKLDDKQNHRLWENRKVMKEIGATKPLDKVDPDKYDAIYFAGGHGAMWDFPQSKALEKVTQSIYDQGGVVAAVCHGPAALINVKDSSGKYLVAGKKVTAFSNDEEKAGGMTDIVPFLLQSKLKERGAKVSVAPNFQPKVIVDGRLVTGQNPASALGTARETLKLLNKK